MLLRCSSNCIRAGIRRSRELRPEGRATMHLPESLLAIACGIFLPLTCVWAEAASDRGTPEQSQSRGPQEQSEAYHKHHDRRHGHNHVYPDRGSILREVPSGAALVNYAGVSYRFYDGIWFEPRGPAFMVVLPPIGLVVPSVPSFATVVDAGGEPYLYADDVYYRARPDLGGYEVVNDPADMATGAAAANGPSAAPPATAPPAAATAQPPAGAPLPAATTPPTSATAPPAVATSAAPPAVAPGSAGAAPAPTVLSQPAAAAANAPAAPPQPSTALPVLTVGSAGGRVLAVPRSAKSQDEQERDHYDCYRFAAAQSGFDPMRTNPPFAQATGQANYERAQAACFEARGYTVR